MKKVLTIILLFLLSTALCSANDDSIKFNGDNYKLLYSVKNKDFGGYLNEYYKRGETYNIWTEMIAVHHFPNAYSPIDRIKDFRAYLSSMNCPSSLTFNDKKNSAIIDFVVINDKRLPLILEFNIFKYEKSEKCGSIALQYAKRYSATTAMQVDEIRRDFEKNRNKMVKKVKKYKIPPIVMEDIDKCKVEYKYEEVNGDKKQEQEQNDSDKSVNTQVDEKVIEDNAETTDEASESDVKDENDINDSNDSIMDDELNNDEIIDDVKNDDNQKAEETEIKETVSAEELNNEIDKEEVQKAPIPDEKQLTIEQKDLDDTKLINAKKEKVKAKKEKKVKKAKKVKKEKSYQVINEKDEYYTRTNKVRTVKKKKNKPYQVVNSKEDYRPSKPRKVKKKKAVKNKAKNRKNNKE